MKNTWKLHTPQWLKREEGSSLVELALLLPPFLLLLVGAVDFGRGYYLSIEVASAAEAGAMYGSLNATGTSGSTEVAALQTNMATAATLDAYDVSGLNATGIFGCECSDGTSVTVGCGTAPTCTTNVVDYVEVDTSATYNPLLQFNLPGIPYIFSSITLYGKSRMRTGH